MIRSWIRIAPLLFVGSGLVTSGASAQNGSAEETSAARFSFADVRAINEAEDRSRTSRNWLIASAGTTAIGWIVFNAAGSQCETISNVRVCPRAANIASVTGAVFVGTGATAALLSGIFLGVRNAQKKRLMRSTQRRLSPDPYEAGESSEERNIRVPGPGRFMIRIPPYSTPEVTLFDTYRLRDAESRRRIARNGLIASSAVFGFSWIFLGAAIPRCAWAGDQLQCNNAGDAHLRIGIGLAGGAAVGMIVSSMVFAARSRKMNQLERSIRHRPRTGFHWSPQSGSFVF